MPDIVNLEENVSLRLELLNSRSTDIVIGRSDFENWVAFYFRLEVGGIAYEFDESFGATFTLAEVKDLMLNIEKIIQIKKEGRKAEAYLFSTLEGYFDLIVEDPLEENQHELTVWISKGSLSKGRMYGYDVGVRFDCSSSVLSTFKSTLEMQYKKLIGNNGFGG
ncbi:hypothetical protein ACJJIR_09825 [Microbulbifer sp. SSSA008]|uniref:WapI family immunity protein n=1 Tax=Microbulbifer sp. SSSA008 TaxID=3243380 RepID=UPI004039671D